MTKTRGTSLRRTLAATTAGTIAIAAALLAASPAAAADTAQVYVVHGVPGLTVDVYVDGQRALDDFKPETVAGPLDLPAGSHAVAITAADATDASNPVLSATADLTAGNSYSLVAHLSADGNPTLTPYSNDISTVPAGQARLVVRHDAAAPAVDVRAGGAVVLSDVTNPNQGALVVPAGTVSADVVLAGTSTVAIGPADVTLTEGTATFVHAVGSADKGDLALVSFTVSGLHSAPGGVPAGTGPAADPALTVFITVLAVAGLALVALGGRRLMAGRTD
ncbi:DUF4397 domain-containing protein [Nakamurella sp.]|uniref:DUF4397 domain-containing protein n=1 Tax=Nakamurella sp. TaxID=1869182 RepID=UPI0037848A92